MELKNKKGSVRNFSILFELVSEKKHYIVYKDIVNPNIYAGLLKKDKLVSITDKEYEYLDSILEKLEKRVV